MNLTPAQAEIARDTHRFRVVNCGRRFGKTALATWEMFGHAVAGADRRVLYVAPTYQQARDISWNELKRVCRPVTVTANESRLELTIKTADGGQSLIYLRGWEAIETARGQKNNFIVPDEVAMYRGFWEGWHEVLRPTLTDTRGQALFLSTPKGFNHFYDLYNKQSEDTDYRSFHFTTYDNPHIPRDEIEKARVELPEDRFAQEYMADFRKMQGLVYPEFSRERDIFNDFTPIGQLAEHVVAIDYGYTNPSAVLHIARDFDNTFWVKSELYASKKTDDEVNEYAYSFKANAYYPDPENASGIEKLKRLGANVREVNKDVIKGIDSVRAAFKNGKIRIHESCKNLINELETYRYPDKRIDNNEPEKPVKEHDHACDALRYAVFMNAPIIEDLDQGAFSLYGASYE